MTDDFRDGFDCAVVLCGDVFAVVLAGVTRARCDAGAFDDAWLLALADAAHVDHLVTGDKRSGLLARRRIGTASILAATAFCKLVE